MRRYLPALVAFVLAIPSWPITVRAFIAVGLACYLALRAENT